jgi:crotonobetainyl-CoA:carnitine CoA-transferase CaiB-like acyl-CoA transferase
MTPTLRVVDFSTHLSGPMASQLLRQLGADIVKIENTGDGDGNRGMAPLIAGKGMFHVALNSGARSISISKRSPHWLEVVRASAAWADAVIVGARPDDARTLGIDYDTLTDANPSLVYCAISGYGEDGPLSAYPAHGQQPDALAGMVPVTWVDGSPETPAGWRSTGTTLAAVFAALGVLAALRTQLTDPGPKYVSVSLWGAALWWKWRDLNTSANLGHGWHDYRDLGSRYAMYPTRDERALIVCPIERKFWESFCDVVGLPDASKAKGRWDASRMDFGEGPGYAEERVLIADRLRTRPLDEWTALLGEAGVPFAPVLTAAEAMESPHARHHGVLAATSVDGTPARVATSPLSVGAAQPRRDAARELPPAPALGEHTREFLTELGLDEAAAAVVDGKLS